MLRFESKRFILLVILALSIIQLKALPGDYLGKEHDDIQHVLLARSMLHGRYILGITPGETPMTTTTPGMPLLVMPAALVFGDRQPGYHVYAWAWLVLCDVLVYLWLRRRLSPKLAALGAAAFALNPLVLARAGSLMTEVPGLALTMLLFLLLDIPGCPAIVAGSLVAFIWLVRQSTIALIPAVAAWYLWPLRRKEERAVLFHRGSLKALQTQRVRQAVVATAIPLAVIVLWSLFLRSQGSEVQEVKELSSAYAGKMHEVFSVSAANLGYYLRILGNMWSPWYLSIPAAVVGSAIVLISILGCASIFFDRGSDCGVAWLLCAGAMYVFWPWQYERYVLPLLPMLFWSLWEGLELILPLGRFEWRFRENALASAVLGLLVFQFMTQGRYLLQESWSRSVPDCRQTYDWIKGNIPPGQAMASAIFARDAWYTGHPFFSLPESQSVPELAKWMKDRRVCCVLWEEGMDLGFSQGEEFRYSVGLRKLRGLLSRPPFKTVYQNQSEKTAIFASRRP